MIENNLICDYTSEVDAVLNLNGLEWKESESAIIEIVKWVIEVSNSQLQLSKDVNGEYYIERLFGNMFGTITDDQIKISTLITHWGIV